MFLILKSFYKYRNRLRFRVSVFQMFFGIFNFWSGLHKKFYSFRPWQNDQTLFIKHLKFACQTQCLTAQHHNHFSSNIFCLKHCRAERVLWRPGQTVTHCLWKELKCLTNNVWSFRLGLIQHSWIHANVSGRQQKHFFPPRHANDSRDMLLPCHSHV